MESGNMSEDSYSCGSMSSQRSDGQPSSIKQTLLDRTFNMYDQISALSNRREQPAENRSIMDRQDLQNFQHYNSHPKEVDDTAQASRDLPILPKTMLNSQPEHLNGSDIQATLSGWSHTYDEKSPQDDRSKDSYGEISLTPSNAPTRSLRKSYETTPNSRNLLDLEHEVNQNQRIIQNLQDDLQLKSNLLKRYSQVERKKKSQLQKKVNRRSPKKGL